MERYADCPKISIITVCYNSEKTIERTITSVIKQPYRNIEYLVIDGGSTDGTIEIIKKYERDITFWCSEDDNGIYDAMNKGICKSSGDIIAFMNSDDYYLKDVLGSVAESFSNTNIDVIYGDYIFESNGNFIEKSYATIDLCEINYYMAICHQAMFFRRRLFDLFGLFDLHYNLAADYDWLLRIYRGGALFQYLSILLCCYSDGGFSVVEGIACAEEMKQISIKALPIENKEKYLDLINRRYEKTIISTEFTRKIKGIEFKYPSLLKKVLADQIGLDEKIYIFSGGYFGIEFVKWCNEAGIEVLGVIDNCSNKWGKKIEGVAILGPQALHNYSGKIVIATLRYQETIRGQLVDLGYKCNSDILTLESIIQNLLKEQNHINMKSQL